MRDNGAHIVRTIRAGLPQEKGEWSMKPFELTAPRSQRKKSWKLAALLMAALSTIVAPRAGAQSDGVIRGQILDIEGKPWAALGLQAVSDQGAKLDAKTDKDGKFLFRNLRYGVWILYVQLPAPNKPYEAQCRVSGAMETEVNLNFKDIAAKQGAEYQEAAKKAEESKSKFEGLKAQDRKSTRLNSSHSQISYAVFCLK